MKNSFLHEGCEYLIIGDGLASLRDSKNACCHFNVPSKVKRQDGMIFKIIKIEKFNLRENECADMITFDESSEINEVPTTFVNCCKSKFQLPPKIKRVRGQNFSFLFTQRSPVIIHDKNNPFITVINKRSILNLNPLELVQQYYLKTRLIIRETVRFIGTGAYRANSLLVHVLFPASVEEIDDSAFYCCRRLCFIKFKGISRLKRIGIDSFGETSIRKVDFPSSVEEIGSGSFENCSKLSSISFKKDSKLKKIGNATFHNTIIKSVDFPSTIEEIGLDAFQTCRRLSVITFPKDCKLKKIGTAAFKMINIVSIKFPSIVEEIGKKAFEKCKELSCISFPQDSNLKKIGKNAFSDTKIESVDFPATIEEIGEEAFENFVQLPRAFAPKKHVEFKEERLDFDGDVFRFPS